MTNHGSLKGFEDKLINFEERQNILNKTFFDKLEKKYYTDIEN